MSEQETTASGQLGDQEGLPGEPGTLEGETGPTETDPQTATGEDAGDVGGESMSDELGEVAGGGEISDTGPSS
ncbi:MAG: hypothetical protein KY439_09490 [Actinobacteria bacterium]|nr:hypothetical protein [Actinomycetota bacterium]